MPWPRLWPSTETQKQSSYGTVAEGVQEAVQDAAQTIKTKAQDAANGSPLTTTSTLKAFTQPQTIIATVALTATCLGFYRLYRKFLRRISQATDIPQSYFRKRSVLGKVTSVGDGDNFRIYHTPGGRLAGWGWLPWRRVPRDKKLLKNETIHVRIAGIDAPELAHFGRPAQPHSQEALNWLTTYVLDRRIRAHLHRADQYSRVVATAYVWRGFLRRDIGLQMLRAGLATVYEAKTGVEFGPGLEHKYREAEAWAKRKRRGMWAGNMKGFETPRQYKNKYAEK